MKTKICSKCKIKKLVKKFYKNRSHNDGFSHYCKKCCEEHCQQPEVKKRKKKYDQKYRQRASVKKYRKEYLQQRKVKRYYQKYYQRTEVKERKKEYYQCPKVKEQRRKYRQRPEVKKRMKTLQKIRLTNPTIKLSSRISSAMRSSLRGNKNGRHWEDLVGYTLQDLKIHLEKQFDDKMNWNNYGSYWSIDHIIAQFWFKFNSYNDIEFKKCWALSNLQPMEKIENIKKGISY